MKAIILAAWEWTRLAPFTNTIPKPMLLIMWKPILEHNMEKIAPYIDEFIIIVKYKKEHIQNFFWNNYLGVPITYHEQSDKKWTAAAIQDIKVENTDILILNWDSIFDAQDLSTIIQSPGYGALVQEVSDPSKYWIFIKDTNGFVSKIVEKPETFVGNLANLWVYKFNSSIIDISNNIPLSSRGEYEITDSINIFLQQETFTLHPIKWNFIDIWYPWDILDANNFFLNTLTESKIEWEIEEWVTIKWCIILEKGALLKSGTYIEGNVYIGKNTSIWPHTYLRWSTVIGENCHIWSSVEIKNSSLGNNTNVAHLSYIWDSIIGNNVNIGWWLITANLRHDKSNIKVMVKWNLIDTKRHKFWVIIWDNSKTWIKTMTYPGRILLNDSFTQPWEIIK